MKRRYQILTFSTIAFSILCPSCGNSPPKAHMVENESLEIPPFPEEERRSFALSAEAKAHNFTGNFLLWSPQVSALHIKEIAEASVRTRVERAKTLDLLVMEWLPAKWEVSRAQSLYNAADLEYRSALTSGFRAEKVRKEVTEPTAHAWFGKRLLELEQSLPLEENWIKLHAPEIRKYFAAYCDAKIWEFAVSKLSVMHFMERPTPLGLCEEYYASKDEISGKVPYFQDPKLCGNATDKEGKNYFDCMWQAGVLLTPQFKYLVDHPLETCVRGGEPGSKAKAILLWTLGSPSLLEQIINDDVNRAKLSNVVMQAGSIPASTPESLGKLYPELKACQVAFRRIDFDRTMRLEQASPGRLVGIGESDGISSSQYSIDLIPRRIPSDETKDAEDYGRLTRLVRMFGWRIPVEGGYGVSVSDLMFNQPVGFDLSEKDPSGALENNKEAIIPDREDLADPAFKAFVEIKNKYVSTIESQRSAAFKALEETKKSFQEKERLMSERATLDQEQTANGLKAVNSPQALSYFHTFSLRLLKEKNQLSASVSIAKPVSTCIDIESRVPCTGLSIGEDDFRDASLEFNAQENKLTFKIPMTIPGNIGFSPLPRTLTDFEQIEAEPLLAFNDIPEASLQGKKLEIIMYGNRLGLLEFFTGDIFITDPETGEKIHTGSLNGDLFDETRRELSIRDGRID